MPTACKSGGKATVTVNGGVIEGNVFGSSRGDVVALDQNLDDQAWTDSTFVTINTGAQVKGNVEEAVQSASADIAEKADTAADAAADAVEEGAQAVEEKAEEILEGPSAETISEVFETMDVEEPTPEYPGEE